MSCRDTARRVRQFQQRDIPLKTFHRNVSKIKALQTANRAERSCSLRPRKAVAFLTHLRPAPKSKGAGSFAVCGQRLRGHVPSKNTSPAALSWSSLTSPVTPVLFVPARCFLLTRRAVSADSRSAHPFRRPSPASEDTSGTASENAAAMPVCCPVSRTVEKMTRSAGTAIAAASTPTETSTAPMSQPLLA